MTGIDCQWSLKLALLLGNKRLIPATNSSKPINMNINTSTSYAHSLVYIHVTWYSVSLKEKKFLCTTVIFSELFSRHRSFIYQQQADDRQSMSDAVTVDKQLAPGGHRNNGEHFHPALLLSDSLVRRHWPCDLQWPQQSHVNEMVSIPLVTPCNFHNFISCFFRENNTDSHHVFSIGLMEAIVNGVTLLRLHVLQLKVIYIYL